MPHTGDFMGYCSAVVGFPNSSSYRRSMFRDGVPNPSVDTLSPDA